MKELQALLSPLRKAVEKYSMIESGDIVSVGVSGGKDSLALLCALSAFRDFGIIPFEICAILIDPGFSKSKAVNSSEVDLTGINELCTRLKVPLIVERTDIAVIVFDERKEKNPCSLCANLRRGALIDLAASLNSTKLALGHHMQDASETVMMNLIHEGRFGCFSPVTVLEDRGVSIIRPFILCTEKTIKSFVKKADLPLISNPCPKDHSSERSTIREVLESFDRRERGVDERIIGALCRSNTDGWK